MSRWFENTFSMRRNQADESNIQDMILRHTPIKDHRLQGKSDAAYDLFYFSVIASVILFITSSTAVRLLSMSDAATVFPLLKAL